MKEQKIICGDRSRMYAKVNCTHEECARHMEEKQRMRQEQYGKRVSFDRADVFDAEGLARLDFWKLFSAANRKAKEGLL